MSPFRGPLARPWVFVGLLGIAAACAAQQQQTPPPGAVPTPEQLRPQLPAQPAPTLPERPIPRELGKPMQEMQIDVAAYAVDDSAPRELREALARITAPYVGKARSYEDLVNAASAVTRFLQSQLGLYLGYAYLPEQEPKDGVVRIAVLEGRLDQVILNWSDKIPVRKEIVEAHLAHLVPGSVLRVRDVERVVFLLNDLRGLTARFELKPGRTPGTASIVVTPQPDKRWEQRVEVDSHGSRYSGEIRASYLAQMNSPTGRGDGLVFNALATHTGGLLFGLASYTTPLGSDGLKVGASLSVVRYRLDKSELPLDLNGDSQTLTTFGLYPVVRSRNLNLFALASLDFKRFDDRQGATGLSRRKSIDEMRLSGSGDWRDSWLTGGVNTYELTWLGGRLHYDTPGASFDTPASFQTLGMGLTRLQNLRDNRLLLYGSVRGQLASANLDNAEQFQLGGPDRVRAFAPGEGTGDEGLVATAELRLLPPESWFGRRSREIVLSSFVDVGHVRFRHDPSRQPSDFVNTTTLGGWGIGGIWDRPHDFSLRVYLAWKFKGTPVNDPVVRSPRIYALFSKTL